MDGLGTLQRSQMEMANGGGLAASRRGLLLLAVLAAVAMARFQRGNGGRSTLAIADCVSVGAGIRRCPLLKIR